MAVVHLAPPRHAIGGDVVDPVLHLAFSVPSAHFPPTFLPQPLHHDVVMISFVAYER